MRRRGVSWLLSANPSPSFLFSSYPVLGPLAQ